MVSPVIQERSVPSKKVWICNTHDIQQTYTIVSYNLKLNIETVICLILTDYLQGENTSIKYVHDIKHN